MSDAKPDMRRVLSHLGTMVGDALEANGFDPNAAAFAITLWPMGMPHNTSTICGSANQNAASELPIALGDAAAKALGGPTHVVDLREGGSA